MCMCSNNDFYDTIAIPYTAINTQYNYKIENTVLCWTIFRLFEKAQIFIPIIFAALCSLNSLHFSIFGFFSIYISLFHLNCKSSDFLVQVCSCDFRLEKIFSTWYTYLYSSVKLKWIFCCFFFFGFKRKNLLFKEIRISWRWKKLYHPLKNVLSDYFKANKQKFMNFSSFCYFSVFNFHLVWLCTDSLETRY